MAIELWAARLERALTARETEAMMRLMPEERRERLLRIRQEERRREPLCAYMILRMALWQRYHWRQWPRIERTSLGKPFFPEHPQVHFGISHTVGAVLVGLSDQPIGVDIEKLRPVSQRAMRRLAGVSSEEAFFESWVRREARTKRTGSGIGTMMRSETPLQYGEYYYDVDTFPGYVAGVATRSGDEPGEVHKYALDEML